MILEADGYDDLNTRAEYLEALTDADERIAERVSALHDEVDRHLRGDRRPEGRASTSRPAGSRPSRAEIAPIRADAEAASRPSSPRRKAEERGRAGRAAGEDLGLGARGPQAGGRGARRSRRGLPRRPLLDPHLHRHVRVRRQLPRAQPLQRWPAAPTRSSPRPGAPTAARAATPHQASKAEQDRIAAIIWGDDGPGAWSCAYRDPPAWRRARRIGYDRWWLI